MKRTGFKKPRYEDYEYVNTPRKSLKRTSIKKKNPKPTNVTKLKKLLWELCRDITRARHGYYCYTCGNHSEHPHTGHFISSSICSVELRYDLKNLRPQCYRCNIHLSGNWLAYELKLKQDEGDVYVDELKDRNQATKGRQYDITWFQNKILEYEKILHEIPN